MSIIIRTSNGTNQILPNLDISTIQYGDSHVAETIGREFTKTTITVVNSPLAQGQEQIVPKEYSFHVPFIRDWLREHYESDPLQSVSREEVQSHYLESSGLDPAGIANISSFRIKIGLAVNQEFGSCGKKVTCLNPPRQRKGDKLKNVYKGLKRKEVFH